MSAQGTQYGENATTRQDFGRDDYEQQQRGGGGGGWNQQQQRRGSRTKPFFLTSEFMTLVATVAAIVIAAAVADNFGAPRAWLLVTIVASAYIVSRGLSKVARGDGRLDR